MSDFPPTLISHCRGRLSQTERAAVDDAHARRRPEAAHLTEQRGTQNWPEAERYYVCRRRDEASLACQRTHELVYRRAGRPTWRWRRICRTHVWIGSASLYDT